MFYRLRPIHYSLTKMAITKQKKTEIITRIEAGLKEAETVTFVNFHGLTVLEVTVLRKSLRDAGVKYYVAKKTLVKRALDAQKVTGTQPPLVGELALAWSDDAVASAKGVFEFQKTHKDKVALMGGVYQGAYMSKDEITTLASIPSMLGLRTQFVGMLNGSIASFVRVIDAKAKKDGEGKEAPVDPKAEAPESTEQPTAEVTPEVKTEEAVPEVPVVAAPAEVVPVA